MNRQTPYVICDIDGTPVDLNKPPRSSPTLDRPHRSSARRRNKKAGKAPKAITTGSRQRGDLPQRHRQPLTATCQPTRARESLDIRSRIGNQIAGIGGCRTNPISPGSAPQHLARHRRDHSTSCGVAPEPTGPPGSGPPVRESPTPSMLGRRTHDEAKRHTPEQIVRKLPRATGCWRGHGARPKCCGISRSLTRRGTDGSRSTAG